MPSGPSPSNTTNTGGGTTPPSPPPTVNGTAVSDHQVVQCRSPTSARHRSHLEPSSTAATPFPRSRASWSPRSPARLGVKQIVSNLQIEPVASSSALLPPGVVLQQPSRCDRTATPVNDCKIADFIPRFVSARLPTAGGEGGRQHLADKPEVGRRLPSPTGSLKELNVSAPSSCPAPASGMAPPNLTSTVGGPERFRAKAAAPSADQERYPETAGCAVPTADVCLNRSHVGACRDLSMCRAA